MVDAIERFDSGGVTELEKDSDLAIFLVDYLDGRRDPASGAWPGERETRRLQNTCHAVEALSELGLGPVSSRLVDPALKWLADMPLLRDLLPQDRRALRIYPMRFKALAALGRFEGARLDADFAALCGYADRQTGWLADVPGEFSRAMNTMIWVDTLLWLRHRGCAEEMWRPHLDPGLDALGAAFDEWLASAAAGEPAPRGRADLRGPREASYAFDLLTRAGRLAGDSAAHQVEAALLAAVERRRGEEIKKILYCGLQLGRHFGDGPAARAATAALIRDVRARYESAALASEPDYAHALVLRVLWAFHQDRLREAMLETLWLRNRQAVRRERAGVEQQHRAALAQLVGRHVGVRLGQIVRLSGTRARGTVYRVHFSLHSDATDQDGHPFSILPDSLRLVIKQGSIESLSRTIRRYAELPPELRPFFARHAQNPETAAEGEAHDWYLVMEDLVGMSPLSDVLDRIDLRAPGRAGHEQIARAAAAIGEALAALHRHRRRAAVASNELGWLYLNPIAEAVNQLCEANGFPELRPFIEDGFQSNGWRARSLSSCLLRLQRNAAALTPAAIGTVHGDCHGRNLMIDADLARVKFVDLETLSYNDDYLTDYGLLLEDVALYRYLPRGQRPDCLAADEILAGPGQVDYPSVPRHAESIQLFQGRLLDHIAAFAAQVGDSGFRPRLWLAIARNLIQLASRQLPAQPFDAHRRKETWKLVVVAYAEAARLLHELADHLDRPQEAPLPSVPFTGQPHRPAQDLAFPLDLLQEAVAQIDVSIVQRRPEGGTQVIAYAIDDQPFAEIALGEAPPTLYLAGRMEEYAQAAGLARAAADRPGILVSLGPDTSLDDVLGLVRQAYFLALGRS